MKKWALMILSIVMMMALAVPALAETGIADNSQEAAHAAYTVEFAYGGHQYVMPGDSSVRLSEILDTVGLTGEVSKVDVSDESLFSAIQKTGEWIVTAHQAFSTTEWMKVSINGVVYEITVTDDSTAGRYSAAAIGGGCNAAGNNITINNGYIDATACSSNVTAGAAIGSGGSYSTSHAAGTVMINGGTVSPMPQGAPR